MRCPRCDSTLIDILDYRGIKCTVCRKCGHDSRDELDAQSSQDILVRKKARKPAIKKPVKREIRL